MKVSVNLSLDPEVWAQAKIQLSNISGWVEATLRQKLGMGMRDAEMEEFALAADIELNKIKLASMEVKLKEMRNKAAVEEAKFVEVKS